MAKFIETINEEDNGVMWMFQNQENIAKDIENFISKNAKDAKRISFLNLSDNTSIDYENSLEKEDVTSILNKNEVVKVAKIAFVTTGVEEEEILTGIEA